MTLNTFEQKLTDSFMLNEPIFTEELLKVFSDCSRAQVFRYVDVAKENNVLIQYDTGVYYMPSFFEYGLSSISSDEVVIKKYIRNNDKVYGVYSGISLLNMFGVTTQMAGVVEIVTNKESSKRRIIKIKNRSYVVKKSRCQITSNNVFAYTVMELFNSIGLDEKISENTKSRIIKYLKDNKVEILQLANIAKIFPSKAVKNLMRSEVIYGLIQ